MVLITLGMWNEEGEHHPRWPVLSSIFMLAVAGLLNFTVPFIGGYVELLQHNPRGPWWRVREYGGAIAAWGLSVAMALLGGGYVLYSCFLSDVAEGFGGRAVFPRMSLRQPLHQPCYDEQYI